MLLDVSNPRLYNPCYVPIIKAMERYVFLMGGGGSGKSTFEAQNEIIKQFNPHTRLLCIRKVKDTCKDSVFAELCGVIEDWNLQPYFEITKSPMYIKNVITGSDVLFRGMDDPEKIKSIRRVSRVWIEEATELTREDFNQIDLRLRGQPNLQIVCTFNPVDEQSWLNMDFWQYGNTDKVRLLHTTYRDNRWAGPEYQTVMDRLREQDPRMYDIYALGKWGNAVEGLVFKFSDIDEVPPEAKFLAYGKDFGYTNDPTTLIGVYQWNGHIILDEVLYRTRMTNGDIVNFYREVGIKPTDEIFADSSEPKSIEDIYRSGYNIQPVIKGPDSIQYGIDTMKLFPILITKRSANLKKEFRNYCWAKDKTGKALNKPIDAFNHGIDAARYACMMRIGKKRPELKVY